MLEPIWEQERPSPADIKKMWGELQVTHEQFQHDASDELLRLLRATHTNGGAEFAVFRLSEHPALHWFGSRNRLEEADFFRKFVALPPVVSALPTLNIDEVKVSNAGFEWAYSLTLDGEIALKLMNGGAYEQFTGTAKEAKEIGGRFCEAMFEDRYTEVQMYRSYKPWAKWFHNVAWDTTWLGFDKRLLRVWLLCVTDTD